MEEEHSTGQTLPPLVLGCASIEDLPAGGGGGERGEWSGQPGAAMPLEVRVLSTAEATRSALETLVSGSDSVQIAAAFVRRGGVEELQLLQRPPSRLQVIAGSDFRLTQIEALEALHAPPQRECRLYFTPEESEEGIFHPKLYVGTVGSDFMAVVGSSNLTQPALTRNIELNVQIAGSLQEPVAQDLTGFFRRLWNSPAVVSLTGDMADAYRADQRVREQLWRQLRHSPEFRQARDLVQRTLLGHLAGRPGRKWLLVTSEENYFTCLGRRRWGDEKYERISQIKPGDLLIFYIKGVHKLGAVVMATTPVYRSAEATWADRQYPYRIDFDIWINPVAPIDFKPLVPRVSFLRRKDEKWGTALQTSSLALPEPDAHLLMETIRVAAAAAELRLTAAEAAEDYRTEDNRPPQERPWTS
jgi:HKD family nuclease/predicted RNA-binding protein